MQTGLPDAIIAAVSRARQSLLLLLAGALVAGACAGSDVSESIETSEASESTGSSDVSEPVVGGDNGSQPIGTGVLTVGGVEHDFEVFTCDLDGYENEGVEFDFDVAGIGTKDGRTFHVFARRSYHSDDDWWIEVIDLDYQDGEEGLHTLHGFSAAESEPFIFMFTPLGLQVEDPVAFVSDLVAETPAGDGTIVVSCPGAAATIPPATATLPPTSTTTAPPATTTVPPTTGTTEAATTSTIATEPAAACDAFAAGLADLLGAAAAELESGAAVAADLAAGVVTASEGAEELLSIAQAFSNLAVGVEELGDPPPQMATAAELAADSFELFESAYESQARGAADGDGALIDEGVELLGEGAALLRELSTAIGDCAASDADAPPSTLATPDETALTVFHKTAEILLRDSAYEGTDEAVLDAAAQAACVALLAGGDVEAAVGAAIAASPANGQTFGSDEQNLVLILVTRGVPLWCPDAVDDQDVFTAEVISTIMNIFFES